MALAKEVHRRPHFDVTAIADMIDFTDFEKAIAKGFEKSATSVALKSSLDALNALGVTSKAAYVLHGTLAEVLAIEFAQARGGHLAAAVTASVKRSIEIAIVDGIETGSGIAAITRDIKAVVGLSDRDARALVAARTKMRAAGVAEGAIQKEISRRSRKMLRRRAETIARTEMISARNVGTLNAWRQEQANGTLSQQARKIWIDADGCPECEDLASQDPIPVSAMFEGDFGGPYQSPPAHPSCRCSMGIVD